VANSLAAVQEGAVHVQGTINGYGERSGNANLCSIVPALLLKLGATCLQPDSLRQLREVSRFVDEISAFAHKAGMHVDGIRKTSHSFEHIDPSLVGNERRILVSELSGASNVLLKAVEMGMQLDKASPEIRTILHQLEGLERDGYEFEAAEASFRLLIHKVLKQHRPFFRLDGYRVIVEKRHKDENCLTEATVKVSVDGRTELTVSEGDGPVDALNNALRAALTPFYPSIRDVTLTDFQVRILDPETATAAKTRVWIESGDGQKTWGTIGVSSNIIEASWEALVDSVEYKLLMDAQAKGNPRG